MKLLHGVRIAILAGAAVLAGAVAGNAQNSQSNGQQNGQNGTSGTQPTPNVPYNPPVVPPTDAGSTGYNGRGSVGYGGSGGGQSSGGVSEGGLNGGGVGRIGKDNPLAEDSPETQQQLEQQQVRARNAERQKQLIADTQRLVALANQLQDEVNKSSKDMLSLDVVRKADEIDKLARTVRDRMKNAN